MKRDQHYTIGKAAAVFSKDRNGGADRMPGLLHLIPMWLVLVLLSGVSSGQIASHLYWGVISQSRVYDEPAAIDPFYVFLLEVETSQNVDHIEFATPGGWVYTIPNDASVISDNVETYHERWDDFDVWGYWAYFTDPYALDDFGDGLYTITLHFPNTSVVQTDVWYGVPDTVYAMAEPIQKPALITPSHNSGVPSPVTFTWDRCIDPNVYDIYLSVTDDAGTTVASDIFEVDVVSSGAYPLNEGWHDVEFAFENYWPSYDDTGLIPFDLIKSNVLMLQFEVLYNSVYRFWSPTTQRHFYTASVTEKDKLVNKYSHAWAFEGTAFHAPATPYYAGLTPVYRFWSSATSSHFYTISAAERDKLVSKYPHVWAYEGPAFYAYPAGQRPPEARPVHRFYKSDGTHFYTMNSTEADKLIKQFSHVYVYEGIAYYAYQ